jgi:ketosteroid isomerase-like protein
MPDIRRTVPAAATGPVTPGGRGWLPYTRAVGNRQVVERFAAALAANDFDAQDALIHDDYVATWPQSGEVIRGRANRRAITEHYPGSEGRLGLGIATARIVGTDDKFISSPLPNWNMVHLQGSGDELTATGTITYPNGETWHYVSLITLRDGKIWRQVDYYAAPFEAPDWRIPYVEREKPGS